MTLLNVSDLNEEQFNAVFKERPADWPWVLTVNLMGDEAPEVNEAGKLVFSPGTDFEVRSNNAGTLRLGIVPNESGEPAFDRPCYKEGEGVATVTWGYNNDNSLSVLLAHEARPAASVTETYSNCVRNYGGYDHVMFAHSPLGFATDKAIYQNINGLIDYDMVAKTENEEELGVQTVINICTPEGDKIAFNPTFGESWSTVRFVQVDLHNFKKALGDDDEIIHSFSLRSLEEIRHAIAYGQTPDGFCVAEGVGTTALAKFLALVDITGIDDWQRLHPPQ